jgi:membrane-bound lytic murein transglycosylase B
MIINWLRLCAFAAVWFLITPAWSADPHPAFRKLAGRLICDGWDSTRITSIFQDERLQFLPKLIPLNAIEREIPDIYQQFLSGAAIKDGFQFLKANEDEIQSILQGSGISPQVAVAILKVESDLGRKPGTHSIFSSLATITLLADSLQWLADYDTSGGANLEAMERRAVRRSKWAYKELGCFLHACERENWDPFGIKGSWAGAFGWAQFLPSSHLLFARDGDGDGIINPYTLSDALASITCFLKGAGWRDRAVSQRRALMQYNPSTAYVDCIMEYTQNLRQMENQIPIEADDAGFGR